MKLLFVVSSLDLTQPFSATPAWWQLLKGLSEIGVDVIVSPYQGPAIESLWWRAAANPAQLQGDAFKFVRDNARRFTRAGNNGSDCGDVPSTSLESFGDRAVRKMAQVLVAPLWHSHLDGWLKREPDIDAVIILNAPLNQLNGVARDLQQRHHKPFFYYDGDVPASLPNMHGFESGFRIYQGGDLSEYTAFISNSVGGMAALKELGARETYPLFYGADPDVFGAMDVPGKDIDVFFYGHGCEYRNHWIDAMVAEPSKLLPDTHFAVRGTKLGYLGEAETLPYLSFSNLREYASRSKINLCITRTTHATIFASSSARPFELASMGCCIVANPYEGIETWFEPDKELFVVGSGEEAIDRYRFLLSHASLRMEVGRAARERVLKEHTFRHRARQLCDIVQKYI